VNTPEALTRQQLCATLQVSDSTVARWLAGGMPYIPVGARTKRFNLTECRAWLQGHYQQCQHGQTKTAAGMSQLWSAGSAFTESCRRVQLRVMPSSSRQN
jgi:hypothetical protein